VGRLLHFHSFLTRGRLGGVSFFGRSEFFGGSRFWGGAGLLRRGLLP